MLAVPAQTSLRILVVDDEAHLREVVALALEAFGYRVFQAGDGEEALSVVGELCGALDVLVTDMRMPRLGGRELIESMRMSCPRTAIICMTGFSEESAFLNQFRRQGGIILSKPFAIEELIEAIRSTFGRLRRSG